MARLLIANGANVNFTNSKMCTPLIAVCKANGIVALAQVLINNGADVNAALENGETAFWWAFFFENLSMARLLIDHGANIHVISNGCLLSALRCIRDPVDRAALELYATPSEKNWRRRKFFAFFLQSLKLWPGSETQRAHQRVLAELPDLQRLIGSFL